MRREIRCGGEEFMAPARKVPVRIEVTSYPLEGVDKAFLHLRSGNLTGAAVIIC